MDEKLEASLNLALNTSEEEREKSEDLNVGYDEDTKEWELIVRYSGNLDEINAFTNGNMRPLSLGYVIVYLPEERIPFFSELDSVIYIEKPKSLLLEVSEGIAASCILPVKSGNNGLTGAGVLVGVIDTGIDVFHPDFVDENGNTKIFILWDQEENEIYTEDEINAALHATQEEQSQRIRERDASGHGTHVASICAGNRGVANQSKLIIVKLSNTSNTGFPRTTQLMQGLKFVLDVAQKERKPVSVNISYGNSYGDHRGNSLLETYISEVALSQESCICIGTGNEGDTGRHKQGRISSREDIYFAVAPYETNLSLQIWKSYEDTFDLFLTSPSGIQRRIENQNGALIYEFGNTSVHVYYGSPTPYNVRQEIYFAWIPNEAFIESGQWILSLEPRSIIQGTYEMWLPVSSGSNVQTRFLEPSTPLTLTIPSTARNIIAVGAYDSNRNEYASFSGRGDERICMNQPDLVAPGVGILGASPGGGYTRRSGTSMATPFVTGSCALMMEWGIVNGEDEYLYGEKVKAYLRRGARPLPGIEEYPNSMVGWGVICLQNSIPV